MNATAPATADSLWSKYVAAEGVHSALFAEQRSNLLLVAGNHYTSKGSKFGQRLREIESITKTQKIRLTKNHLQRITKTYVNNLLMYAPAVGVSAKNEAEISDQKVAELHHSVWMDIRERHKFSKLTRQWARDFIEIGECIAKVFFDKNAGKFLGYGLLRDQHGNHITDEEGQPIYETPEFTGDLVFERILGFNLLVDPEARSWEEIRYAIYRKMIPVAELSAQFDDEDVKNKIKESATSTYKIFDPTTGAIRDDEGMVMVCEHYYRPCAQFPKGYYFISVEEAILHEEELPLGIFPIVYAGFDEASTSARSFSIIKQLRPYQAEINRAASKIAEHQITLGDDKVILSNGATMSPGGTAHGVKAIHVTGMDPKVFAGRTGEQYVGYMTGQIQEMYQASCVDMDDAKEQSGQLDPYAILYRTAKQKKPFMIYIQKFEEFLVEICRIALTLAKQFYHDEMLIPAIGRREHINVEEFRSSEDIGYQIRVQPENDDLETKMGKQLVLNHLIQYGGASLKGEDIAKLMRYMPWGNKELVMQELTQDWDNWVNDRLTLDRGKAVPAQPGENHAYIIQRIRGRVKEKDFDILPGEARLAYQMKLQEHIQFQAQEALEAQRAEAGFIPSGGFMITVNTYVPDPADPTKSKLLKIPSESIDWLVKALESQGSTQEAMAGFDDHTKGMIGQAMHGQMQQLPANQQTMVA